MIKKIDNIILVGTSHISKESIKRIDECYDKYNPEIVCLELDKNRLEGLLNPNNKKMSRKDKKNLRKQIGFFGYLFYLVSSKMQNSVAKKVGMKPGVDMLRGYNLAKEKNLKLALIDLPIIYTLKKVSKIRNKLKLVLKLLFSGSKKDNKDLLNFDIKKIPKDELILRVIELIKKETPQLYQILIEDRNKYMVDKLLKIREEKQGPILAVVGAAHVEGMSKILNFKLNEFNKPDFNLVL